MERCVQKHHDLWKDLVVNSNFLGNAIHQRNGGCREKPEAIRTVTDT